MVSSVKSEARDSSSGRLDSKKDSGRIPARFSASSSASFLSGPRLSRFWISWFVWRSLSTALSNSAARLSFDMAGNLPSVPSENIPEQSEFTLTLEANQHESNVVSQQSDNVLFVPNRNVLLTEARWG